MLVSWALAVVKSEVRKKAQNAKNTFNDVDNITVILKFLNETHSLVYADYLKVKYTAIFCICKYENKSEIALSILFI